MTTVEMNIEFLRLLKTINNQLVLQELPDTETILEMLNIAQLRYLKEIYLKDGQYELVLTKAEELRDLVRRELLTLTRITSSGPLQNIAYSTSLGGLSNEYMFFLRADVSMATRTGVHSISGATWTPCEYITHGNKEKFLTSHVNTPIIVQPGCYIENDGTNNTLIVLHDIYTTLTTTDGLSIEFIKKPIDLTLSQNSELPNFMHEDIVRFAANSYVDEYKFRLQTKSNNKNETK